MKCRLSKDAIDELDIKWVLTVPAIWNDAAKQFMREAAQEVGIDKKHLTIALEPEAASLYCRHLPVEKSGPEKKSLSIFGPGKRYLVLDAGGGTVDITVHEVMTDGRLKELHKASGGAWGGTKVDDAYLEILVEITGTDTHQRTKVMDDFRKNYVDDYIDLFRDFELKKRSIGKENDSEVLILKLPLSLLTLVQETRQKTLEALIMSTKYKNDITLQNVKLRINLRIAKGFFNAAIHSITNHVKDIFSDLKCKNVDTILMVGGFSESPLLQHEIRDSFPDKQIIIPEEAGLAVLKGAVIFGHDPSMIFSRVSKYTYGTDIACLFDASKHPVDKKTVYKDGVARCKGAFSTLVKCGDNLVVGEAQKEQVYYTILDDQTSIGMDIYVSLNKVPKYIDDESCCRKATCTIPLSGKGKDREVKVKMIFGGTELDLQCKEIATGKVTHLKVDFLS